MSIPDFVISLIKLLKPEFYNKLTWVVVIAGLALMVTPFWEPLLVALMNREYNLNLTPGGNTQWGLALVIIGLLYHLISNSILKLMEYRDRKRKDAEKLKHDCERFRASLEILSEEQLKDFFELLLSDHSYRTTDASRLHDYAEFHLSPRNKFLDNEIQSAAQNLSKSINALLNWISLNFFVFPDNQTGDNLRLCMHPYSNIDRGGNGKSEDFEKYDTATEKLRALSVSVQQAYINYRMLVKDNLFI